ncbi:SubName: Full=Uncharacterized protein {ECO:0000313/EMBL:CCA73366.1} [Serendipita indica DSM 11827]|nr:SubName: Full=Uncharacterized protein {ECO:0000313/EMBL:CCA73366.1} [Serendipita indica DSM 11827]
MDGGSSIAPTALGSLFRPTTSTSFRQKSEIAFARLHLDSKSQMASESSALLPDHPSPTTTGSRFVQSSFITPSFLWKSGAISMAVGMIAGAFGSHGLRSRMASEQLESWKIASNYSIFNGLALLVISSHPRFSRHVYAGPAILFGSIVFSASIMALVLNRERFRFLGPITPVGGTLMISGYIALAL